MSRYLGNATTQDDDDLHHDPLKYEMEFKGKIMDEEYARITETMNNVESHCHNLNQKVVKFQTKVGDTCRELEEIEEEDANLDITELKKKIDDGKKVMRNVASMKTIHSDDAFCDTCGTGHKKDYECSTHNNTRGDLARGWKTGRTFNSDGSVENKVMSKNFIGYFYGWNWFFLFFGFLG